MKQLSLFIGLILLLTFSCQKEKLIINTSPTVNSQTFTIAENIPNDSVIGIITGNANDNGQIIVYKIIDGNVNGAFAIDSLTGLLKVANSVEIDYEKHKSFDLKIAVTDNGQWPLTDTTIVHINLTDVRYPKNGMVAYYSFDNTLLDSVSGDTAFSKQIGFYTDRFGQKNKAVDLIGIDTIYSTINNMRHIIFYYISYITFPNPKYFDSPERTISFWFKQKATDNITETLFALDNNQLANGRLVISSEKIASSLNLNVKVGDASMTTTIVLNNWYNVVVITSGANAKLYINNSLVGETNSATKDNSTSGSTDAVLGADQTLQGSFFEGLIDDLLIYNRALDSAEIKILYKE